MCFHGNQLSWGIKHPLITLPSKDHFPLYLCFHNACSHYLKSRRDQLCLHSVFSSCMTSIFSALQSIIHLIPVPFNLPSFIFFFLVQFSFFRLSLNRSFLLTVACARICLVHDSLVHLSVRRLHIQFIIDIDVFSG